MTYQLLLLEHIVMKATRQSYSSDVSDAEWEFLAPYLTLMSEDAPQREYPLRELFDAMKAPRAVNLSPVEANTFFLEPARDRWQRLLWLAKRFNTPPATATSA